MTIPELITKLWEVRREFHKGHEGISEYTTPDEELVICADLTEFIRGLENREKAW